MKIPKKPRESKRQRAFARLTGMELVLERNAWVYRQIHTRWIVRLYDMSTVLIIDTHQGYWAREMARVWCVRQGIDYDRALALSCALESLHARDLDDGTVRVLKLVGDELLDRVWSLRLLTMRGREIVEEPVDL